MVSLAEKMAANVDMSAFGKAEELKKNNLPSINALIRDGNINIKYGEDKITDQYEYVLLERKVKWYI